MLSVYVDLRGRRYSIEQDLTTGTYLAVRPCFRGMRVRRFRTAGEAMRWLRWLVPGGLRLEEEGESNAER